MARPNVKDKRKAQLIGAALDSIAKRGLMETTITHISKGAGMSRGIVNFYFTSKEMMLREALKTLIDEYEAEWREAFLKANGEATERLQALIIIHFSKKLCSAKRLNIMSVFWGHAATQAAYRHLLEAADQRIETALTETIAHALSSPLEEARNVATQLHALIRGLWLSFLLNPKDSLREELIAHALSYIDRVAGAPVRIVRDHTVAVAIAPEAPKEAPKAKPKAKKSEAAGQMDIEDLFSRSL